MANTGRGGDRASKGYSFKKAAYYAREGLKRPKVTAPNHHRGAKNGSSTPQNPFSYSALCNFSKTRAGKFVVGGIGCLLTFAAFSSAMLRTPTQQERDDFMEGFTNRINRIELNYAKHGEKPNPTLIFSLNGQNFGSVGGGANTALQAKVEQAAKEMTVIPDGCFVSEGAWGDKTYDCIEVGSKSPLGRHAVRWALRSMGLER